MADGTVKIEVILDDSKVKGGIDRVEGSFNRMGGSVKRGIASVGKLAGALGLVGLASKGIDMVKNSLDGAIDRYDTLNNFPRVMEQIGFDAQTSEKAINKLSDGIQGLPTRLDEVAATAQNIAIMTGDLDGAVDTTLALNNAFLASGASAQDAQRGLDQYVQMLAKGEVDLQSWRTLQETMPYALRKTAEAFGFTGESATNDFYDALKAGDITMSEFNDKLIELDQAQGGFAETAKTASAGIRTALTNMSTWFVMGVADIIEAIDKALGGVGSIEGAINRLKPIVQGVFGFIANIVIPAIGVAIRYLIDAFNQVKSVVSGWAGASENGLSQVLNIYRNYLTILWTYVQEVFTFIRDIIMKILPPVVDFIRGILEQIYNFFEQNGQQIVQAVKNAFEIIRSTIGFIMPVILFIVQDVWNAIKNVIQGAVNVILGIIKVFSSLFTGDWRGVWDGIVQLLKGALQAIWGLINLWLLGRVIKAGKALFTGLRSIFTSLWNAARSIFTSGVNAVRNSVNAGFTFIRNIITTVMNGIRSLITNVWNAIRSTTTTVVNAIRNTISNTFNALRGIVANAFNGVRSAISSGLNGALNVVRNMANRFREAGRRIVTSIANGIRSAIGAVTSAIGDVTSKIRGFLPFSPAKYGALRDIMDIKISESIAKAIQKGEGTAIRAIRDLTDKLHAEIIPSVNLGRIQSITPEGAIGLNTLTNPYRLFTQQMPQTEKIGPTVERKVYIQSVVELDGKEIARGTIDELDHLIEQRQIRKLRARGL